MGDDPLDAWLRTLPPSVLGALVARFVELLDADEGRFVAEAGKVPSAVLSPLVLDDAVIEDVSASAHAILRGISVLARGVMSEPSGARRASLLSPFSAVPGGDAVVRLCSATWAHAERIATARVDFMVDPDGHAWALELNPTIPAGQGYSDIFAASLVRACGEVGGLDAGTIDALVARNHSNVDDLLDALLDHDAQATGVPAGLRTIAIVTREGDSYLGELRYAARRFGARGHRVVLTTPTHVARAGDRVLVDGEAIDVVYSHVMFARLDPRGDYAQMLFEPRRYRIWNPPASHLSPKAWLALLSELSSPGAEAQASAHGLDEALTMQLRRCMPWTRLVTSGSTTGLDGEAVDDLLAYASARGPDLVLKHSLGFGGESVFLGRDLEDPLTQARLQRRLRLDRPIAWAELIERCGREPGAWIVQRAIDARPRRVLEIDDGELHERERFHDLAAYTSLGNSARPTGVMCRASTTRLTNLAFGGAMVPVLRAAVRDALMASTGREKAPETVLASGASVSDPNEI